MTDRPLGKSETKNSMVNEIKLGEEPLGFLKKSRAEPDYGYYAKLGKWDLHQCTCFLLGRDPSEYDTLSIAIMSSRSPCDESDKEYVKMNELINSCVGKYTGVKNRDEIDPLKFIELTEFLQIQLPPELVRLVREHREKSFNESLPMNNKDADKPLHKKEKDSLVKMLAGSLANLYGRDAILKEEIRASEIQSDNDKVGITLSEDTTRKYLNLASKELQKSENEQN